MLTEALNSQWQFYTNLFCASHTIVSVTITVYFRLSESLISKQKWNTKFFKQLLELQMIS